VEDWQDLDPLVISAEHNEMARTRNAPPLLRGALAAVANMSGTNLGGSPALLFTPAGRGFSRRSRNAALNSRS
jgi:hypothetical protein